MLSLWFLNELDTEQLGLIGTKVEETHRNCDLDREKKALQTHVKFSLSITALVLGPKMALLHLCQ